MGDATTSDPPYPLFIKEGGTCVNLNTDIEITMPSNYTGSIDTSQFAAKCGFSVESRRLVANSITTLTINACRPDKSEGAFPETQAIALLTLYDHCPNHSADYGMLADNHALVSRADSKPGRRLSANDIAKNIMADTLVFDRPLTDDDVNEVLDAWKFNKNTVRKM